MVYKLFLHELLDFLKHPPLWILVFLPIIMSKLIIGVMRETQQDFMLLPSWILFAQVMVGIMITAPNYIEEKEHKTLDALMVSPLTLPEVIIAKCSCILVFSVLSQLLVYVVNIGVDQQLMSILPIMLLGGTLFILVGLVIGLAMQSSKTASAVASIVMITFFLLGTLYQMLPDWEKVLQYFPSVVVVENLIDLLNGDETIWNVGLLLVWVLVPSFLVAQFVRKELNR